MNYDQLNEFIYSYLTDNKTNSAIMLSGDWGTGKSYYIKNSLVKYINRRKKKCLIISLYGINTLEELTSNLFWAARIGDIDKKDNASEKIEKSINLKKNIVSFTRLIAKGTSSHFGINITDDDSDLLTLYKMLKLSNNLIILEDVERTGIDITQLLGFINCLVEQDDNKVLLVANENEIIRKIGKNSDVNDDAENKENSKFSSVDNYTIEKEKTISDTIQFECDIESSIKSIVDSFNNKMLSSLCSSNSPEEIASIMYIFETYNLRAIKFACQKTIDVFKEIPIEVSDDFLRCIFYSTISFSLRLKGGNTFEWQFADKYSYELGVLQYPLFKFCYDYIIYQNLDQGKIEKAFMEYKRLCLYDRTKTQNDNDILVLCNYLCEYEEDVKKAVVSITERLKNATDISFYDYGRIVAYLILIKHYLKIDVSVALDLIVFNLQGRGNEIKADELLQLSLGNEETEIVNEYKDLELKIRTALKTDEVIEGFSYKPSQCTLLYEYVHRNEIEFHSREKFAALFDVKKLIEMYSKCSPKEMQDLRLAFDYIYRINNIGNILSGDLSYLVAIRLGIADYYNEEMGDRCQLIQTEKFLKGLDSYINKLK